jgi:hypothetical protein
MMAAGEPKIFIWHGRDLTEDTRRLTAAVAEAGALVLFEDNGGLGWFNDGKLTPVNRSMLPGIIATWIKGVRLVNCGPNLEVECFTFEFAPGDTNQEPNDLVLTSLMRDILPLLAKAPRTPLNQFQVNQVVSRLKQGEPPASVANGMGVDVELVKRLRLRA